MARSTSLLSPRVAAVCALFKSHRAEKQHLLIVFILSPGILPYRKAKFDGWFWLARAFFCTDRVPYDPVKHYNVRYTIIALYAAKGTPYLDKLIIELVSALENANARIRSNFRRTEKGAESLFGPG